MKKQKVSVLVIVTAVFAAFILGFLMGRNGSRGGVTVSVPEAMETEPAAWSAPTLPSRQDAVYPVNINTASREELLTLPGIGPVLAQRILDYREAYGSFSSVEELLLIEDIGEKRLESIIEYITVEDKK